MKEKMPAFDNHDTRIKYYELLLERKHLEDLPEYDLPEGYHFAFYKPGDRDAWINIEKEAKEFSSHAEGLDAWRRYYYDKENELLDRMVFIENEQCEKVATATAFYDVTGRDTSGAAWLHWVAVKRSHQGKGLSKPLILYVLKIMKQLGYTHAKIPTQTYTWLACKIYLDFGFTPIPQNAVHSRNGWRIIKAITDHPALVGFDAASINEITSSDDRSMGYEETRGHA